MHLKITHALCGLTLLSACATQAPCPTTTIETDTIITERAVSAAYRPILASRFDTEGTIARIRAHNNVYWCANEDVQPDAFDQSVCAGDDRE